MKMKKKPILLGVIVASLVIGGFYLTTTNLFTFVKAYVLYKQTKDDFKQTVEAETKELINEQKLYSKLPKIGEKIGALTIPRIKAKIPIYHGTDEDELEKGIGHYAKSVLPGEKDNSVLSGHRDTVFRELGKVKIGDSLIVKTVAGTFTYEVRKIRIVDKDDRTVIVPKIKPTLTISSCYPFRYIGPAPQRYIVVANLVKSELTTN